MALPVTEDQNTAMAVTLPFRAQLQIGTAFSTTLDQAIQAADRHVYVHGQPRNPLSFVEDWINLLRWEVNNLWEVQAAQSCYQRNRGRNLTHEHYKRSGEILAEGVAIAFLEDRLRVPRQRFFFVNGSDARPDFVVKLKARHRTALLLNRMRFMLEVRSRSGMRNLTAADRSELANKKTAMGAAGVLAVYCCYGAGSHRDGTSRTRIHLADPPGDETREVSDADVSGTTIHHYLRITSQLGLWRHRDHLLRVAQAREDTKVRFPKLESHFIEFGVGRPEDGQTYRGREFNDLLELASSEPKTLAERDATRERIRRRVNAGEFGAMVFRGLNEDVLRMIEDSDWLRLADYRDPATTEHSVDRWIRTDGLFRSEVAIGADSALARDLIKALGPALQ